MLNFPVLPSSFTKSPLSFFCSFLSPTTSLLYPSICIYYYEDFGMHMGLGCLSPPPWPTWESSKEVKQNPCLTTSIKEEERGRGFMDHQLLKDGHHSNCFSHSVITTYIRTEGYTESVHKRAIDIPSYWLHPRHTRTGTRWVCGLGRDAGFLLAFVGG